MTITEIKNIKEDDFIEYLEPNAIKTFFGLSLTKHVCSVKGVNWSNNALFLEQMFIDGKYVPCDVGYWYDGTKCRKLSDNEKSKLLGNADNLEDVINQ